MTSLHRLNTTLKACIISWLSTADVLAFTQTSKGLYAELSMAHLPALELMYSQVCMMDPKKGPVPTYSGVTIPCLSHRSHSIRVSFEISKATANGGKLQILAFGKNQHRTKVPWMDDNSCRLVRGGDGGNTIELHSLQQQKKIIFESESAPRGSPLKVSLDITPKDDEVYEVWYSINEDAMLLVENLIIQTVVPKREAIVFESYRQLAKFNLVELLDVDDNSDDCNNYDDSIFMQRSIQLSCFSLHVLAFAEDAVNFGSLSILADFEQFFERWQFGQFSNNNILANKSAFIYQIDNFVTSIQEENAAIQGYWNEQKALHYSGHVGTTTSSVTDLSHVLGNPPARYRDSFFLHVLWIAVRCIGVRDERFKSRKSWNNIKEWLKMYGFPVDEDGALACIEVMVASLMVNTSTPENRTQADEDDGIATFSAM